MLLDVNVLAALVIAGHEHHRATSARVAGLDRLLTCPIVDLGLLRLLVRLGATGTEAQQTVAGIHRDPRHEHVPDDVAVTDLDVGMLIGHRQVTDAYLATLARRRQVHLLTWDRGLVAVHADVAVLVEP